MFFLVFDSIFQLADMILTRYFNMHFYKYQFNFRYREVLKYNKIKISEEVLKSLLEIPQVVDIIKKRVFSSKTDIKKILKTARRNETSDDVVNKIPNRVDGIKNQDQTSKYTILNNCAYYVHHDCDKNHKVRLKVGVPCPWYGHEGCGFKLFTQTFIYKLVPKKRRVVLWSTSM